MTSMAMHQSPRWVGSRLHPCSHTQSLTGPQLHAVPAAAVVPAPASRASPTASESESVDERDLLSDHDASSASACSDSLPAGHSNKRTGRWVSRVVRESSHPACRPRVESGSLRTQQRRCATGASSMFDVCVRCQEEGGRGQDDAPDAWHQRDVRHPEADAECSSHIAVDTKRDWRAASSRGSRCEEQQCAPCAVEAHDSKRAAWPRWKGENRADRETRAPDETPALLEQRGCDGGCTP